MNYDLTNRQCDLLVAAIARVFGDISNKIIREELIDISNQLIPSGDMNRVRKILDKMKEKK